MNFSPHFVSYALFPGRQSPTTFSCFWGWGVEANPGPRPSPGPLDLRPAGSTIWGFEMESSDQAQVAIKAMNGQDSNGRALTVNEARPRKDRGSKNSNGPEGVGTNNLVEKMGRINFNFSAVRNLFQRRLPSSRDNSVTPRAV